MIDLHTHTTHSDGRLTPTQLIEHAAQAGLTTLAITDHDGVNGIGEAQAAAAEYGLEVIPGIELTAHWGRRTVHLLGYFIDPEHPALVSHLADAERQMADHVSLMLSESERQGVVVTEAHLARHHSCYPTGTTVLLSLVRHRLLARLQSPWSMMRLAARQPRTLDVLPGIGLIHAAGGVAVLAHPARIHRGNPRLNTEDLERLVIAGLDGLEADTPAHRAETSCHYRQVADDLGIVATGGSDFHGNGLSLRVGSHGISPDGFAALRAARTTFVG